MPTSRRIERPLSGDMEAPGYSEPDRGRQSHANLTAWGRLTKNQSTGQSAILDYDGARPVAKAVVDFFQLSGEVADACQMTISIAAPRVVVDAFDDVILRPPMNANASRSNAEDAGANFPGTSDPLAWPPFEVVVEWGCGGDNMVMSVDVTNGCQFGLTASFVRVYARLVLPEDAGLVATAARYQLAATAGPGWPTGAVPTKTVYMGVVGSGLESVVQAVPKFAKRASLVSCDTSAAPAVTTAYLRFWQSKNGAAGDTCVGNFYQSGNQPIAFPIPAGAQYMSVLSGMASDVLMSVITELG